MVGWGSVKNLKRPQLEANVPVVSNTLNLRDLLCWRKRRKLSSHGGDRDAIEDRPHRLRSSVKKIIWLDPEIPEDLYHLIKKAVVISKHLERNKKDS